MAHELKMDEGKKANRIFLPHKSYEIQLQIRWKSYGIDKPERAYSEELVLEAVREYLEKHGIQED